MSLTVSYDPELKVIKTVLRDTVDPTELQQEIIQAAALGKEHNCKLFFTDCSQASIEFSIVDVYKLPDLKNNVGLDRSSRMAVLAPNSKLRNDLIDFYELVSRNRGWMAKVFQDRQEAMDWLFEK